MIVPMLASVLSVATAMPSYIAVPADQIAFVDLSNLHVRRVPRQTLAPPPLPNLYTQDYQPIPIQQYEQDPSSILLPPAPEAPARLVRIQQLPQQQQPLQQQQQQLQQQQLQQQQESAPQATQGQSAQLAERPPDFGEFVDFGAHTGDSGAFGWYADFPVNNHHDDHSGFRK
ncbi:hypothetical protein evm_009914 [Chilo suppressalis]|nr:hypothetical protein evm_009914 [Chilo suppressalis]